MLLAPSITPWRARIGRQLRTSAHNPAVRLYQYDPHSFAMLDVMQYYIDLNTVTTKENAKWKLEYKMTDTYQMPNITARSLQNLVDSFKVFITSI